jgi:hypothetical protein
MSEFKPCPFLNDRVVLGESINANCEAPNKDCCPKIRSTKKAVTRQCWRMVMLTPEEAAVKEAAKAERVRKPREAKEPKAPKAAKLKKVVNPPAELMGEATHEVVAAGINSGHTNVYEDTL